MISDFMTHILKNRYNVITTPPIVPLGYNDIWQTDEQDAQLSQRDRAAGCIIVIAKNAK